MPEIKVLCPECLEKGQKSKMQKSGTVWSGRHKVQRYKCPACGRTTVKPGQ